MHQKNGINVTLSVAKGPGTMGAIFEPPAPPTDCFVAALLAMTDGGRFLAGAQNDRISAQNDI